MANRFGISDQDEKEIRARDKACVYCHKAMTTSGEAETAKTPRVDLATIEHLNFDPPFYVRDGLKIEDVAICCSACNSSRSQRRLWNWFGSEYCRSRGINENTVAEPVKKYLRELPPALREFIESVQWSPARTYAATWPHEYIVQEKVDPELFSSMARLIYSRGYEGSFYEEKYIYFDYAEHTYWHMENIINRCLKSETYARRKAEGRLPKTAGS